MTCALACLVDIVDGLEIPIRPYSEAMNVLDKETRRMKRVERRLLQSKLASDDSGSLRIQYASIRKYHASKREYFDMPRYVPRVYACVPE